MVQDYEGVANPLACYAIPSLIVRHTPKAIIVWMLSKAIAAITLEPMPLAFP